MSDRTTCPLCNKSVSFAGLPKHIFSSLHKNDLIVGLQKRKVALTRDIKMFPATGCIPYIQVKGKHYLHLCFGCNKCYYQHHNFQKQHSCPKLSEGLKVVQSILDAPTLVLPTTQEPEPQATPLPTPTPSDFIDPEGKGRPLAVVISAFQRDIKRLNSIIESDKQVVEEAEAKSAKADMFLAGLNYCIEYMKGEEKEVYHSFLPNFKEEHPDILAFVDL